MHASLGLHAGCMQKHLWAAALQHASQGLLVGEVAVAKLQGHVHLATMVPVGCRAWWRWQQSTRLQCVLSVG